MPKSKQQPNSDKTNMVLIAIIIAVIAFGGGFLLAGMVDSDATTTESTEDQSSTEMTSQEHSHEMFNVPADQAPSVALEVFEDSMSGWNVHIITSDFTFTPENASTSTNVLGEGHAHLYVNGEKVARVYGDWFHYPETHSGDVEFKVTLNANDHSDYAVSGEVVSASVVTHSHSDSNQTHDHQH